MVSRSTSAKVIADLFEHDITPGLTVSRTHWYHTLQTSVLSATSIVRYRVRRKKRYQTKQKGRKSGSRFLVSISGYNAVCTAVDRLRAESPELCELSLLCGEGWGASRVGVPTKRINQW